MKYKRLKDEATGKHYLDVALADYLLLRNSILNKGMAFPKHEREEFGLVGLLPPHESTLEEQLKRSYDTFNSKPNNLQKYIYLRDLQDSNETLFFALLQQYLVEMMPIIYTPVVGEACQQYSQIYRYPRGLYLSYPDKEHIEKILANPAFDYVSSIVVSDGERILGLGDQGAGGMGIPIGKLALYTACAGLHPATTLPILLDTGTNNQERIQDPLYIGWRHERIRGKAYDDFIETFVTAVIKRFPHVLLQWEDFAQQNANKILTRYRDRLCSFNDDIQGTAAVAAGALFAAINITGTRLRDQRIVVAGAGSAGCGISELLARAMIADGLSEAEARARFYLVDQHGLLTEGMQDLMPFQAPFVHHKAHIAAWKYADVNHISLADVVKHVKPTLLIGVSGQPGLFTEAIVREMASQVERPIIFPLSNPTSRSEAAPADLLQWTNDHAIVGTGSPYEPVMRYGQIYRVDQTNNCYIFPGLGLGLITVKATRVTDEMFMIAAQALAACSPSKHDPRANLLPDIKEIREVSFRVALAVAKYASENNLSDRQYTETELIAAIRDQMWTPKYLPYRRRKRRVI